MNDILTQSGLKKALLGMEKNSQDIKENLGRSWMNRLILKQRLFLLRVHAGTPIKSHIEEFFSIINDLDKIEIKIEDKDQAFLLLYSLPS